jgi:hypothetical protein
MNFTMITVITGDTAIGLHYMTGYDAVPPSPDATALKHSWFGSGNSLVHQRISFAFLRGIRY